MPVFNGICKSCKKTKKFLTVRGDWDSISVTKKKCLCGGEIERDAIGVNSSVKETMDNGAMPRAVERYANIEELREERLKNADPNAGRKNIH